MELIDFDGLFDKKLTEYMKKNGGKRTEKEWENLIPELTELVNENKLVRTYDGILGFKAGHSKKSGYTLALAAERNEQRYISEILGCDDENERFTAGKSLLADGFFDV